MNICIADKLYELSLIHIYPLVGQAGEDAVPVLAEQGVLVVGVRVKQVLQFQRKISSPGQPGSPVHPKAAGRPVPLGAVSYTHLDVYKRQTCHQAGFCPFYWTPFVPSSRQRIFLILDTIFGVAILPTRIL